MTDDRDIAAALRLPDLRHSCSPPDLSDVLPMYGERSQVMARWRCPECRARWRYEASFLDHDRMYWERASRPSRRWLRAERRRVLRGLTDA